MPQPPRLRVARAGVRHEQVSERIGAASVLRRRRLTGYFPVQFALPLQFRPSFQLRKALRKRMSLVREGA